MFFTAFTASTEIFEVGVSSQWRYVSPLPNKMNEAAAVTLNNNHLTQLDLSVTQHGLQPGLQAVTLHHNPWQCSSQQDCQWITAALHTFNRSAVRYLSRVTCLDGEEKHRNLLAFTEYGERPLVVVYDLELRRKLKLLRCAEFRSDQVVSLAFSHDSKYLLVQGGPPEYQLVYFFWEKGKVITSISRLVAQTSAGAVNVKDVSFHPKVTKIYNLDHKY